ncbi:MAG: CoA transferase [Clostridia bacterium]|nr:CoA transferase [Clostridia bacterium]
MKQGILDGIRVIDFTKAIAGPLCGTYLADMGAEVIKVEAIKPDFSRVSGAKVGEFAGYFTSVNLGKKSIALDLKTPEGKKVFTELIKTADVLLENNRPGVMDRLGFGVEACKALNPKMIYCSVSGFGQTGPYAMRPAYDLAAQAMGGTMHITGTEDTIPLNHGAPTADVMTAQNATIAILASLFARERTGIAQRVETSLLESVVSSLRAQTPEYLIDGKVPMREGSKFLSACPYEAYKAKDGYFVFAGMGTWAMFCTDILGRPDLVEDERFVKTDARMKNRPALREIIEEWAADKTVASIVDTYAAKMPCAPVNDFAQVCNDPHIRDAREMFIEIPLADGNKMTVTNNPIKMSDFRCRPLAGPSRQGGDNDAVLAELGFDEATIAQYRENGIIL